MLKFLSTIKKKHTVKALPTLRPHYQDPFFVLNLQENITNIASSYDEYMSHLRVLN